MTRACSRTISKFGISGNGNSLRRYAIEHRAAHFLCTAFTFKPILARGSFRY